MSEAEIEAFRMGWQLAFNVMRLREGTFSTGDGNRVCRSPDAKDALTQIEAALAKMIERKEQNDDRS